MKWIRYTLYLLVLMSGSAFSHTALKESFPAQGSELNVSPEQIQLSFTEEVRLLRLDVVAALDSSEKKVDIGFAPESVAKTEYSVPLPALSPGNYRVDWSVMGADSHPVQGSVAFSIGTEGNMHEHQEGHAVTHGSQAAH
ncbi:MAG: copper resistance protein CopC [Gammaproteobacteria bacterium]